jgi:lambda family phage portal protein
MLARIQSALRAFQNPGLIGRSAAFFDAAGAGNRLKNWTPPASDFTATLTPALVRSRSRDAYRNNSWARRAVDLLAVGAVGAGIKPQLRIADPALKAAATRAWSMWTDAADHAERLDFYGLQQALVRQLATDGEALVRLLLDPAAAVPLRLQLLGAEYLDNARVDARTLNGIAYDAAGRRTDYWIYPQHPATAPGLASVRIPADQVLHIFHPQRPGEERGTPLLAPALVALRELQQYFEAALVRQQVASLYCGFVVTPDGSNPLSNGGVPSLEPGSMIRLRPGESVEFNEAPEAGQTFEPFVRGQLRAIACALGLPYELLSGDVSQVTFASGRHAILEYRRQLESLQHHVIVFQFCRPVFAAWARLAVAAGVLPGPAEALIEAVRWIAPLPEMLDPKAEVQATLARVRAGFMSRSEAVSLTGLDADLLDAEIAADNARADRLGLILDSDPRRATAQGQAQQDGPQGAN